MYCIKIVSGANAAYVQTLGQQNRKRNQYLHGPDSKSTCHVLMHPCISLGAQPQALQWSAPDALERLHVALGAATSSGGCDMGRADIGRRNHLLHGATRAGCAPEVLHTAVPRWER